MSEMEEDSEYETREFWKSLPWTQNMLRGLRVQKAGAYTKLMKACAESTDPNVRGAVRDFVNKGIMVTVFEGGKSTDG